MGVNSNTYSIATSDTQYRFSIGVTSKNEYIGRVSKLYIDTRYSIDTPILILHLCL